MFASHRMFPENPEETQIILATVILGYDVYDRHHTRNQTQFHQAAVSDNSLFHEVVTNWICTPTILHPVHPFILIRPSWTVILITIIM